MKQLVRLVSSWSLACTPDWTKKKNSYQLVIPAFGAQAGFWSTVAGQPANYQLGPTKLVTMFQKNALEPTGFSSRGAKNWWREPRDYALGHVRLFYFAYIDISSMHTICHVHNMCKRLCVFSHLSVVYCVYCSGELWGENRSCAVSINRTSNGSLKHILQQIDRLVLWRSFWQRIPHSSLFMQPPSSYHSYYRSLSTQLSLSLSFSLSLVSCHTNLLCILNSNLMASFML